MVIHSTIYVENKQTLEYNVDYALNTHPTPHPPQKKKKKKKNIWLFFASSVLSSNSEGDVWYMATDEYYLAYTIHRITIANIRLHSISESKFTAL